jgi:hypothetical protein
MTKRNTDHRRAARAAIHLILSNSGGVFFLLLASRTAPYSQSREATVALHRLIEERVRQHLGRVIVTLDLDDAARALLIATKAPVVTARVTALLPRCASRSPSDFTRWLERQIADAIDDDEDPHGGPAAPTPAASPSSSWALDTLPLPRAEREALVAAVMKELTPAEREILQAMTNPKATWVNTARTLGLSVFAAKRLHQCALERAHQVAVRLATAAAGLPEASAPPAPAAAA